LIALPEVQLPIHNAQADFRLSEAFVRGYVGGRGCGKTWIGALDGIQRARDGDHGMIVSQTYTTLEDTVWPTFESLARQLGRWIRGRMTPSPKCWIRTRDGGRAEFVFRSGERPDSLRGPNKSWLWIDEASIQNVNVFRYGLPVLRQRPGEGENKCILTFTPKGSQHWTFETFYEQVPEDEDLTGAVEICGRYYWLRSGRHLSHAHTLDNPFLPPDYHDNMADNYSSALAAQELAGLFVDLQGLMFFREWFETVDAVPTRADIQRVRYWDKAASTTGENARSAYTAGVLMDRIPISTDGLQAWYLIEDVVRGRWSPIDRNKVMRETAEADAKRYNNSVHIYFEQEGGSGGKESANITIRELCRYPVHRDIVSGKQMQTVDRQRVPGEAKIVRAQPWCAQSEAGNIKLLHGAWNTEWLAEVCAFPESHIMDQVDATSGAYNKLQKYSGLDVSQLDTLDAPRPEPGKHGVTVMGGRLKGSRRPVSKRRRCY
jgi:phage terminase large subunit-like protein